MNKPTRRIRRNFAFALLNSFAAIFLLLGLTAFGRAQSGNTATDGFTPEGLKTGAPAGSFQLSGFDSINYFNGNLNFSLPLLSIGGRGSAAYGIPLRIEHKWRVIKTPHPGGTAFGYVNTPEPNNWQSTDPGYGPGIACLRHPPHAHRFSDDQFGQRNQLCWPGQRVLLHGQRLPHPSSAFEEDRLFGQHFKRS
ncbi:MAG: hypothetical protein AAB401_12720 [Acidobacteriota bacterium]